MWRATSSRRISPSFGVRWPSPFPAYDGGAIALLHLDVDLYESYKTALDWLWPFVSPGGIVTFDEYRSEAFPGATRAIDEFLHRWQLKAVQSRFLDRWYVVKAVE